jgi:hypothetical protein
MARAALVLSLFQVALSSAPQERAREVVIKGTIADFAGAPVKAAKISVVVHDHKSTSLAATSSSGSGLFRLKVKISGQCDLAVHAEGFQDSVLALDLSPAQTDADVGTVKLKIDCSSPEVNCDDFGMGKQK